MRKRRNEGGLDGDAEILSDEDGGLLSDRKGHRIGIAANVARYYRQVWTTRKNVDGYELQFKGVSRGGNENVPATLSPVVP